MYPSRVTPSRRIAVAAAGVVLAAVALLGVAAPALAQDPNDIGPGPVVDQSTSNVSLDGIADAIAQLKQRAGISLSVVYVDDFNDGDPTDWANQTAADSQLTDPKDVLLAIGIQARGYGVSVDQGLGLSDEQLSKAENDDLVPDLQNNDWTGAAIAYARALGDLATGTDTGSKAIHDTSSGGSPAWLVPVGGTAAVVVIGGAFLLAWLHGRRARRRAS